MQISIQQMTVIRALASWRSQADVFASLHKASLYFRLFCLKSSLELFRAYAAGAADHIRAVNFYIQAQSFDIWRADARLITNSYRVTNARALSLVDYSFQMLRKSAIDRARSKVFLQSASNFHMFAAWFQLKSFRDDSVRSNSLMQADPTDIAGEHGVPAGDSKAGLAADILLRGATPAMRQKVVRSNENRVLPPSSGNLLQAGQANEICFLVMGKSTELLSVSLSM